MKESIEYCVVGSPFDDYGAWVEVSFGEARRIVGWLRRAGEVFELSTTRRGPVIAADTSCVPLLYRCLSDWVTGPVPAPEPPAVGAVFDDSAAPGRTARLDAVDPAPDHCPSCTCEPMVSITYLTDGQGQPIELVSALGLAAFTSRFKLSPA